MLYKELQSSKQKYLLVIFGFVLVGFAVSTLLNPARSLSGISIFHSWALGTVFLTIGAAILIGADSIAEESGKNTLSFLLTRPISRTRIYAAKYFINAAFLSAVLLTTSLLMFVVEMLSPSHIGDMMGPDGTIYFRSIYVNIMSADEAFTYMAVILGVGLAVLALTTFVSIFSSSTINTIVFTILIGLGLMVIYSLIDFFFQISYSISTLFDLNNGVRIIDFVVLLAIAAGIYFVGLKIFKAREF